MLGDFNSEIYFATDDNVIVEPIANYFSEKVSEKEDGGLFHWILKNNLTDSEDSCFDSCFVKEKTDSEDSCFVKEKTDLEDSCFVKENFLIISVDKLQTLNKNFIEQFHNVCVYKNDFALTFKDIQKIYDKSEPRAIFYFEDRLDLAKFVECQALFYTCSSSCNDFAIVDFYTVLTTNDARILNVKFCPETEAFNKKISEPVAVIFYNSEAEDVPGILELREKISGTPIVDFLTGSSDNAEIRNLYGFFYAEEILTEETTAPKKFLAEVAKILPNSEINLFLRSFYALKNIFAEFGLKLVEEIPNRYVEFKGGNFTAEVSYESEIVYPGKVIHYVADDGTEINFDVNLNLTVEICNESSHISGDIYQNEFVSWIGPKSFERSLWNDWVHEDIVQVKNFEELKSTLIEPTNYFELKNFPRRRANESETCYAFIGKLNEKLKDILSDSKNFARNISDMEDLIREIIKYFDAEDNL